MSSFFRWGNESKEHLSAPALGTKPTAYDFTNSVWQVVFGQCSDLCHHHVFFCFIFTCLFSPSWNPSSALLCLFRLCVLCNMDGWGGVADKLNSCKSGFLQKLEGACHNWNIFSYFLLHKGLLLSFLKQLRLSTQLMWKKISAFNIQHKVES